LKPDDLPLDGKQTFAWPMDPTTRGTDPPAAQSLL
jgi:hypothetical protein